MITTDLAGALADLEQLDPEPLAERVLERTGEAALKLDQQHPHVGWQDRTGQLHDSFRYEVETGRQKAVLTGIADTEYAIYLHAREGYSVLRAFDSFAVAQMLQEAFNQEPDITL